MVMPRLRQVVMAPVHPAWQAPKVGRGAVRTIVAAGLTAGSLDAVAASTFYSGTPARIFRYVASGLLGPTAREGGAGTALFGLLLHFVVALSVAAVFYTASRRLGWLSRHPGWAGPAYGVIVYFVMRLVVLPLSAVTLGPLTWPAVLKGVAIHCCCIGLPIALVVRHLGGPARAGG
jgi:hypothetical protein